MKTKRFIVSALAVIMVFALMPIYTNDTVDAAAKKLSISKKSASIIVGKTLTLKIKNVGKKKIKWETSNKKIATVSSKGKVSAKKKGTATITAKVGKTTFKCKITVKNPPQPKLGDFKKPADPMKKIKLEEKSGTMEFQLLEPPLKGEEAVEAIKALGVWDKVKDNSSFYDLVFFKFNVKAVKKYASPFTLGVGHILHAQNVFNEYGNKMSDTKDALVDTKYYLHGGLKAGQNATLYAAFWVPRGKKELLAPIKYLTPADKFGQRAEKEYWFKYSF